MFHVPFLAVGGLLGLPAVAAAARAVAERRHNVRRWLEIEAAAAASGGDRPRHSPTQAFIQGAFTTGRT